MAMKYSSSPTKMASSLKSKNGEIVFLNLSALCENEEESVRRFIRFNGHFHCNGNCAFSTWWQQLASASIG